VKAEAYAHVPPDQDMILAAARFWGDRAGDASSLQEALAPKLVKVLRGVIAQRPFAEWEADHEEFIDQLRTALQGELGASGLALEDVPLVRLERIPE